MSRPLVSVALAVALAAGLAPRGAAQPRVALVADADFSAEAGARTLLAGRADLQGYEDRLLPLRVGPERTAAGKALGVAYRLGRFVLIDAPVDQVVGLLQHEIFGHGARYREFGWEDVGYTFNAPLPYGPGGGAAYFEAPGGVFTPDERGATAISGSHANAVLADVVLEGAFQRGRLPYRDAALYLGTATDAARYVLNYGTLNGDFDLYASNDADSWRASLNLRAARLGRGPVSLEDARAAARLALLDPMLYVGLYAIVRGYLVDGAPDVGVPMVRLGGVGYLPAVRFDWGPHGGEVLLDHRLVRGEQTALVRMRRSAPSVEATWGLGAAVTGLRGAAGVEVDAGLDVWRQPALQLDPDDPSDETGGGVGGAVRATAHVPLALMDGRAGLFVQLGLKTAGFVGADPLGSGPVLRVGVSLREPARPPDSAP